MSRWLAEWRSLTPRERRLGLIVALAPLWAGLAGMLGTALTGVPQ